MKKSESGGSIRSLQLEVGQYDTVPRRDVRWRKVELPSTIHCDDYKNSEMTNPMMDQRLVDDRSSEFRDWDSNGTSQHGNRLIQIVTRQEWVNEV